MFGMGGLRMCDSRVRAFRVWASLLCRSDERGRSPRFRLRKIVRMDYWRALRADHRMPAVFWQDRARCRQYDPELFFDPRGRAERKAKAVCDRCPVRTECLALALESRAEFGVWGGLN